MRGRRERENRYQWRRGQISLGERTRQWHRGTYISRRRGQISEKLTVILGKVQISVEKLANVSV